MDIAQETSDATLNVVLDTLKLGKQALVFCGSKAGAEKQAEEIARKATGSDIELSERLKHVLSSPTKQCDRLGKCALKGIAFHHSGLHSKQREIIEDEFRHGRVKIICCTPTLAAGLNLPAFRSVIRDLKRYGGRFGMSYIPVLEYLQMAGRAGRPGYDTYGESICIAKQENDVPEITEKYLLGEAEAIYSKLAVEPVLRTYLLSLIATRYVSTKTEIMQFFSETFWAHQFRDLHELESIIDKMLELLQTWEFLEGPERSDFVSGDEVDSGKFIATPLGTRVAELYLDPLTAHQFVEALEAAPRKTLKNFTFMHLISMCNELQPLLRVKNSEWDHINEESAKYQTHLLLPEPNVYDSDFEDYLNALKTALMLEDWCEEKNDEYLLEHYNCRPGETRAKIERGYWLLYTLAEIARLRGSLEIVKDINKARFRLRHGVKEELLPLLKLEGVGRARARILFHNKIRTLGDVKEVSITTLAQLLGPRIAASLKKQMGEDVKEIPRGTRKGQTSLTRYE